MDIHISQDTIGVETKFWIFFGYIQDLAGVMDFSWFFIGVHPIPPHSTPFHPGPPHSTPFHPDRGSETGCLAIS